MYQWIETKHKRTCEQNYYTYSLEWCEDFHDSEAFHESSSHHNSPKDFFRKSEEILAKDVHLGEYFVSDELKKMTKNKIPIEVNEEIINKANPYFVEEIKSLGKNMHIDGNYIYVSSEKGISN